MRQGLMSHAIDSLGAGGPTCHPYCAASGSSVHLPNPRGRDDDLAAADPVEYPISRKMKARMRVDEGWLTSSSSVRRQPCDGNDAALTTWADSVHFQQPAESP
jgi:hypothetical protein